MTKRTTASIFVARVRVAALLLSTTALVGVLASGPALAQSVTATGDVDPAGAANPWTVSGPVRVGDTGTGTLSILNGGTVDNTAGVIGGGASSNGTATVAGTGSQWNNSMDLTVGNLGIGLLSIASGGVVSNTFGFVGHNAGSNGMATVNGTGSQWLNSSTLYVGHTGTGTLGIENGGFVSNTNGVIGQNTGSIGAVTVTGSGSQWTNSSTLDIGFNGTGTLNIENGGRVGNTLSQIGANAGSSGTVTVIGSGSQWNNSSSLYVGASGTGTLNIGAGGIVSTAGAGVIGNTIGSIGTVTVNGAGSQWTSNGALTVGFNGTGTLTIQAGGLVTNTGDGYIGSGSDSIGTVTVTGTGSKWNSNSINDLFVGDFGRGTLTIADSAVVKINSGAGTLNVANTGFSSGTLNVGAASGSPAVAAGTLDAANVVFGVGTGVINFNHTDTNYTFAPGISGNGTINQVAGVTKLTGNSSGFTGTTNVNGGSLYVNNNLGGTVNVNGGTLGGSGTLTGALTIGSGGNIAPGNSIGTLNVANITINAGSTYTVELNNGGFVAGTNNDLINATGTATINGGTVHVTPVNGTDNGTTYTPGTYTILTAAGGVTGTFTTLTDDYAFLNFALSYNTNNVFLTSSIAVTTFCLPGMSGNQCAAGNGVYSLGSGSLFDAVLNLSNAAAPGAMDQLSGEIHASAKTALIEDSRFAREAALERLRIALGGVSNNPSQAEKRINDNFAFWGQGFGSWGNWASDGNAAKFDRSIGGFLLGGDVRVADDIRLGLMGGYSRSSFSTSARRSSGTADTYTLGTYAGGQWDAFSLKGGLAHSWHSLDTSRSVAFTGFSDSLSASYNARTFQAFGEAGYGFDVGGARITPFANLAHVNLSTDGYAETGGAAALTAGSQSTGVTFTTLGLRGETKVDLGGTTASLTGMAGWRHAFGDVAPMSTHAFAGGNNFTVAGVPIAKDALVLDLGAAVNLTKDATLGFSYNGQFASGFSDQGLKANFNVKF